MAQNGTSIVLKIGSKVLVGELSSGVSITCDIINVSSKQSGRKRKILPGTVSKTITFESLADPGSSDYGFVDARTAITSGTLVAWSRVRGVTVIQSGSGYIQSINKTNPHSDRSTLTGTLEITGLTS